MGCLGVHKYSRLFTSLKIMPHKRVEVKIGDKPNGDNPNVHEFNHLGLHEQKDMPDAASMLTKDETTNTTKPGMVSDRTTPFNLDKRGRHTNAQEKSDVFSYHVHFIFDGKSSNTVRNTIIDESWQDRFLTLVTSRCEQDTNGEALCPLKELTSQTIVAHDEEMRVLSTLFEKLDERKCAPKSSPVPVGHYASVADIHLRWNMANIMARNKLIEWKTVRDDRLLRIKQALALQEEHVTMYNVPLPDAESRAKKPHAPDTIWFPSVRLLGSLLDEANDIAEGIRLSQFFFAMNFKTDSNGRPLFKTSDFNTERGFQFGTAIFDDRDDDKKFVDYPTMFESNYEEAKRAYHSTSGCLC